MDSVYSDDSYIDSVWYEKLKIAYKDGAIQEEILNAFDEWFNELILKLEKKYSDVEFSTLKENFKEQRSELEQYIKEKHKMMF